jgi:hypothetical protein
MKKILGATILLIITFVLIIGQNFSNNDVEAAQAADGDSRTTGSRKDASLSISFDDADSLESIDLRSQTGAVIEFRSKNGLTLNGKAPQKKDIPHLVLYRNGVLTAPEERTLVMTVNGLPAPTTGTSLTIQYETQHPDPDMGSANRSAIPVWETLYVIEGPRLGEGITFTHTFAADLTNGKLNIATPTDYYRMRIILTDDQHPEEHPLFIYEEDYVFLLENQWNFALPEVNEDGEGAAPDELVIYYCDMFPYQTDYLDASSRMSRADVETYVRDDLGPAMVDAFLVQSTGWGFTWHSGWTSYRSGVDAERLSVALTSPGVWFHGRAPSSAHSGISINTTSKEYAKYDDLLHGMMSAFHHELFHNLQRNINLHYGGDGDVDGEEDEWAFITEGMAILASSVGQPEVEFSEDGSYLSQANTFLSGGKFNQHDLNTRYADLDPYRASIYWRFLYEQCGGFTGGKENPAAGMRVIRRTLEALYSLRIGETLSSDKPGSGRLVDFLPALMDVVLRQTPLCPFNSYRESLVQFSLNVYAIRISDECVLDESRTWCGLYNPKNHYSAPPAEEVVFDSKGTMVSGRIPSSYGMDFIELHGSGGDETQSITVEFQNHSDAAEFDVQLLWIDELEDGLVPGEKKMPVVQRLSIENAEGQNTYKFAVEETEAGEHLALIITRIDGDEIFDPVGEYSVSLR